MFRRVFSLINEQNFNKIKNTKVLIVGLGGVGGYAFESLIRSGIYNIDIIDFDKIEISNLNRQIITNQDNIGLFKVDEAKKRALSINPKININAIKLFLDKDNISKLDKYDYIVDACDSIDTKIELIKYSVNNNIKLISCMGTAKKLNPEKLTITTLDKTNYDPIARIIRNKLKKEHINLKKVKVVSSDEKVIDCNDLGSLVFVPAVAGLLCSSYIINDILS